MVKQYWLADYKNTEKHGWSMDIELIDGPHAEAKGVREAKHIIQGIGLDKGKKRNYVMVTIDDIPKGKIDVNEEAIKQNSHVVACDSRGNSLLGECVQCGAKSILADGLCYGGGTISN